MTDDFGEQLDAILGKGAKSVRAECVLDSDVCVQLWYTHDEDYPADVPMWEPIITIVQSDLGMMYVRPCEVAALHAALDTCLAVAAGSPFHCGPDRVAELRRAGLDWPVSFEAYGDEADVFASLDGKEDDA